MLQMYQPMSGVVRHLIIINVLMFIGTYVLLGSEHYVFEGGVEVLELGRMWLAVYMPGSEHFAPFQVVTHMFMHGDVFHLLFNMLSLYWFGSAVEMIWGHRRFLFYYLFCGIGAMISHLLVQWWSLERAGINPVDYDGAMLGASGAVFGLYAAYAYLLPDQVISLLFPPISLKAKHFVLIMGALELMYGVRGTGSGVAHFAHLGGAFFGFGLIMFWFRGSRGRLF